MKSIKSYSFYPFAVLVIVSLLSILPETGRAHHSHASLNLKDIQQHRGTVKRYGWGMPHVFLKVTAPNPKGEVVEYTIELLHPPAMVERGWSKNSFKPGDQITWSGPADKNPNRYYSGLEWAEKADGTRLTVNKELQPIEPSTDLTGIWRRAKRSGFAYFPPDDWPYTQLAQDLVNSFDENQNPQIECQNPGPPKSTLLPYPIKISRPDNKTVVIDYELRDESRVIYLDRESPPGKPSKIGRSKGWFEGDVLVVETDNFIADRWGLHTGVDSSEEKHLIERFQLIEGGMVLNVQMTVTDPVYLTKPVIIDHYFDKLWDRELVNAPCTLENSKLFLEAGLPPKSKE